MLLDQLDLTGAFPFRTGPGVGPPSREPSVLFVVRGPPPKRRPPAKTPNRRFTKSQDSGMASAASHAGRSRNVLFPSSLEFTHFCTPRTFSCSDFFRCPGDNFPWTVPFLRQNHQETIPLFFSLPADSLEIFGHLVSAQPFAGPPKMYRCATYMRSEKSPPKPPSTHRVLCF